MTTTNNKPAGEEKGGGEQRQRNEGGGGKESLLTLCQKQLRWATLDLDYDRDNDGDAAAADAIAKKGNDECADCDEKDPTWVILPWGCFICTKCSGVHRSLGVHISFVRSLELDKLTPEELSSVRNAGGNKAINSELEYHVPSYDYYKPDTKTNRSEREKYIRAKYEHKEFHEDRHKNRERRPPVHKPRNGKNGNGRYGDDDDDDDAEDNLKKERSNAGLIEYSGMVKVTLFRGEKLSPRDMNMKSDPYVVIRSGQQTMRSKTIPVTLNPHWNESLTICWEKGKLLTFTVYDEDEFSEDDFMGTVAVDISDIPANDGVLMRAFLEPDEIIAEEYHKLTAESVSPRPAHWKRLSANKRMNLKKQFDKKYREKNLEGGRKNRMGNILFRSMNVFEQVTGYIDFMIEYVPIDH